MLSAFAKGRPTNQTPAEWELAIRQRLKPPEITLRSYGGGGLDIVGQLTATIQSGPYRKMAVVLVQNRAPEDLLLGTDLQPYLGFQLSQKSTGGPMVDLLPCLEVHPSEESPKPTDQEQSPAVVRLLQAVRLPAHHARVVRARVNTPACAKTPMFRPTDSVLLEPGWDAEEGLVEVEDDHTMTLVLRNPSDVTIHLEEEDVLGELQPVFEVPTTGDPEECTSPVLCQVSVSER